MRLKNNPLAMKNLENSGFLINDFPYSINTNTILELGMGKGEMITELAFQNPNVNYVGIEKYATAAEKAAKKAKKLNLQNFKIIVCDIKDLLNLLNGQVNLIWLTFSDPWPKKKHFKRRLTYKTFLEIYKKLLTTNGVVKFKTDNDKLFEFTIESLKEFGAKITKKTLDLHKSEWANTNVMTGYEKKWSEKNKNINFLEFKF
ncbi:tRNA (guanosine(46)-N7)-methyltransferase TrmB [Mesomycoplasma neurolyticum]|uniref:tRNA (guanine-N(7)-)-methyltransferase n=1 Tax=Mesomycoplasma neurolyticum TaxID=2120 RepID=A0A449A6I1_9BACT|nr:tRNA (guanosine(46)-N7)-methyltransferase TrmB [Mesomycoplasma neurolyticum]VEU59763.1 tRNA (guanine-N(7)-)-methyltransferase [Mesomycoplasma neurolyticum]